MTGIQHRTNVPARSSVFRCSVLFGIALTTVACGSAPPPPKPVVPPKVVEAPPPPPKPECVSLSEKCVAEDTTRAKVPDTAMFFTPPPGWLYAQEDEVTLAQTPDGGPCLAMASFESTGNVKANRAATLDVLTRSLGLSLPEPKGKEKQLVDWEKSEFDQPVGDVTLSVWQFDKGTTRAGRPGPLIVFSFERSGRTALGLGYAPKDDTTEADAAIMAALDTLVIAEENPYGQTDSDSQ